MNDTDLLFDFLKSRQLHCSKKLDIVGVINFGGGKENYCLTNAENKANELGYAVISGWLALPLKKMKIPGKSSLLSTGGIMIKSLGGM
jgi:hypothetical protein